MRLRSARRNPAELLIVNPRPRSGSPRVVRRPFRRPSLARPAFARPNPGHKAVRPKARPAPKRRVKAKKTVKARKPARKTPAKRKSAMAIKKRRKRSKRKASKHAKRRARKARRNPIKRRRRRSSKARRNPAKRRKRRKSRRNPLIMRGAGKKARFSWLGRTKSGKRKRRAKPISKRSARRRVKRGEVVLVRKGRGWSQASAKSVASAIKPRRRRKKAKKARKSAKRRSRAVHVAARANPRRRRRSRKARRNPSRKRRSRKSRARRSRKAGRKHSRLHAAMAMRRNPSLKGVLQDLKALAPQALAATASVAAHMFLVGKLAGKPGESPVDKALAMVPGVGGKLVPHSKAITAALLTGAVYAVASMVPQLSKVKGGVAIGGIVTTALLLAQSVKIGDKSLAATVGLPGLAGPVRMGQPGGILGEYTNVGEYTNIGEYTSVGGLDDRSPMALMGMDDASVFAEDSLRGMDDAAPFAPGEGGILAGKMF